MVPVPAGVSLDVACMVPCSGITALGAINNAMPVVHDSIRNKGEHLHAFEFYVHNGRGPQSVNILLVVQLVCCVRLVFCTRVWCWWCGHVGR